MTGFNVDLIRNRQGFKDYRLSPPEKIVVKNIFYCVIKCVAVHLGVMMADTLSFTAKVDVVDF